MKSCPTCGKEFADEFRFCNGCGSALVEKPVPPPGLEPTPLPSPAPVPRAAPLPSQAPALAGPSLASVLGRFLAHVIDLIFLALIFVMVGNSYGAHFGGLTEGGFELNGVPALIIMGVTALVFFLYLILFEGLLGATPGKFLLGIRVKTVESKPCTFGQAVIRNLLRIVDALAIYLVGLVVVVLTKRRQRVGDLAAHTIVVRESGSALARGLSVLFLVVFTVVIAIGSYYVRRHARVVTADLTITSLRFAQSETESPRSSLNFSPGDEVRLFYDVKGCATDAAFDVSLVIRYRVLGPDGSSVTDLSPTQVNGHAGVSPAKVNGHLFLNLPQSASGGKYTINLSAEDLVAHKTATSIATFNVLGAAATAAPTSLPEGGFGVTRFRFAESADAAQRTGTDYLREDDVRVFYDVVGYTADGSGNIDVLAHNQVIAPDGKPFTDDKIIEVKQMISDTATPVRCNFHVPIPPWAPPGEYDLNLLTEDQVSHKRSLASYAFTVNGPPVETSTSFMARHIELAADTDAPAANPPNFRAGQSVWLGFQVAGMKADVNGHVNVTEDWGVFGPDGKALFQKNGDSIIDDTFAYVPAFYPVREYTATHPDTPPGTYRFKVVLHDKIIGADYTFDQPFTVSRN